MCPVARAARGSFLTESWSSHLNPAQVQQAVNDARRRAASEAKDPDKVKAAATEAADMLRYWMANALNRSEMIQLESARMRLELETKSRQWKIAAMVAGRFGDSGDRRDLAAHRVPPQAGPRIFSATRLPDRASALPTAGGNRAVVDLGPPPR